MPPIFYEVPFMSHDSTIIAPWYKQPWLWFILSPILAAMTVAFVVLLPNAIKQQQIDPPLDREFVRDGRGYVLDDKMAEYAKQLGIKGEMQIDIETGQVILTMLEGLTDSLEEIELHIKIGANHDLDHAIKLKRVATLNQFFGSLSQPINARSTFIIVSNAENWKVVKDARPPFSNTIAFTP